MLPRRHLAFSLRMPEPCFLALTIDRRRASAYDEAANATSYDMPLMQIRLPLTPARFTTLRSATQHALLRHVAAAL